jgi:hypothetical protein
VAAHSLRVDLVDVDDVALRKAIRREPRPLRRRLSAVREDVTGGAADAIVAAAPQRGAPRRELAPQDPLGDGGYDLVVADLLYTQLLFPALCDAGIGREERGLALARWGQALTDSVVTRLHRSAREGDVVHLHDAAGWWDGRPQPLSLEQVLRSPDAGAALRGLVAPQGCDLELSLERAGVGVRSRSHWRWPFQEGVDYLVLAVVAAGVPAAVARPPGGPW